MIEPNGGNQSVQSHHFAAFHVPVTPIPEMAVSLSSGTLDAEVVVPNPPAAGCHLICYLVVTTFYLMYNPALGTGGLESES